MRSPVLFLALFGLIPLFARAQDPEAGLMARAQKAYAAGDDAAAETGFSEVVQRNPQNVLAIQYLRRINLRQGAGPKPKDQLGGLVIPKIEFRDATFSVALNALRDQAAKQSISVSFVSQLTPEQMAHPVTISLSNVPFMEALRYLCSLNAATYRVERYAIVIMSRAAASPAPARPRPRPHIKNFYDQSPSAGAANEHLPARPIQITSDPLQRRAFLAHPHQRPCHQADHSVEKPRPPDTQSDERPLPAESNFVDGPHRVLVRFSRGSRQSPRKSCVPRKRLARPASSVRHISGAGQMPGAAIFKRRQDAPVPDAVLVDFAPGVEKRA